MPIFVGPLTSAGVVPFGEGAEILWIKFKLGSFMPHLPVRDFLDTETTLPDASSRSFWLKGSAWEVPDYENVEAFVDRLAREDVLLRDPVVDEVLGGRLKAMPARTVRQRFLRATGLSQGHIYQIERAKRAAELLQRGESILDTVFEVGYYDQPHLTRSLRRWVGQTPAQILRLSQPN
jgi:AraC-like DNA-binding protein